MILDLDLLRQKVHTPGYMFLGDFLPFDRRRMRLVLGGGTSGSSGIGSWILLSGGRSITIF